MATPIKKETILPPAPSRNLFEEISRWSLYLLVFLVPLWFLPFTQNILDYQKQALLFVLVFVGVLAWGAKVLSKRELNVRFTWIHLPIALLVVVTGISTFFSSWRYVSFWGWPLEAGDGFLSILLLALFAFLLTQVLSNAKELFWLMVLLGGAVALTGAVALLQLYRVFSLPFGANFTMMGTPNDVAVAAAALFPLAAALSLAVAKPLLRAILWGIGGLLAAVVLLVNFTTAWIVFGIGVLFMLVFGVVALRERKDFTWTFVLIGLLAVTLFFLMFSSFSLPGSPRTSVELPSELPLVFQYQEIEMPLLLGVLQESPVFGYGPATFQLAYAKYHSQDLNQTIFWGQRFSSGVGEVADWLVTNGVLGVLALLALFGVALGRGGYALLRQQFESPLGTFALGAYASLAALIAAAFLYPENLTLSFLLWTLLGMLGWIIGKETKSISLAPPSFVALGAAFLFSLVLVFGLGLFFTGAKTYAAELRYAQGMLAVQRGDIDESIRKLTSATNLSPSVDLYWRQLSQVFLAKARSIAQEGGSPEERALLQRNVIQAALASTKRAVDAAPLNVANWNVRGFVYRNMMNVEGAARFAKEAYEEAAKLEPASPYSWAELGRVYALEAQLPENQQDSAKQAILYEKALENLQMALELKRDYAPAHYLIATVYSQQGRTEEEAAQLEEAAALNPSDPGVAFQLGTTYWFAGNMEQARRAFERARALNPQYANARYMLGLAYERLGRTRDAVQEFEAVSLLNPGNQEVQRILTNLRSGRTALEGITPSQPPISVMPPEVGG
ncbi:MAG: tetratricopeptide repeat protein [Patescibacteria group bacterium]